MLNSKHTGTILTLILMPLMAMLMGVSCKSTAAQKNSGIEVPDDFKLVLYHQGCRGTCPDYRITVEANGDVLYFGNHEVEQMGNWTKKLSNKEVAALYQILVDQDFWQYEEGYGTNVADLPGIVTTVTRNGEVKMVRNIRGGPEALKSLEQKLEEMIGSDGYEKQKE